MYATDSIYLPNQSGTASGGFFGSGGGIRLNNNIRLRSPYVSALSLWAFCHGLIQIASTKRAQIEHDGTPLQEFIDHAFDMALRSLRA